MTRDADLWAPYNRPTAPDPAEAATILRRLVYQIDTGELAAPPLLVARLEGAIVALEALAEGRMPTAEDLLDDGSD